ncbi:MAG: gliding motility-associated C-terminal domain-containing protein [Chitinophagales bacterium]
MKLLLRAGLLCVFIWVATCETAMATHYRAGEIIYRRTGNLTYEADVITYSKTSYPSNLADRDIITIDWGDGDTDSIARINGPDADGNGFPDGEDFPGLDIKKNVYRGSHTYAGVPPPPKNFFVISFEDQNRIDGINNIANGSSVNVPFFVEDTLKFPTDVANIGLNSSPVLQNPPIDYANVNDTFFHNPAAVDPDGDSLIYELIPPLQGALGLQVPLYQFPDAYCQANGYPNDVFVIDRFTGQITWAVPCQQGIFNIAILIHEYRNGVNMGTLIRDMQIIVLSEPNDPPILTDVRDTCVWAGSTLTAHFTAVDSNTNQLVTITGYGGPFEAAVSPAVLNATVGNPAQANFTWNTVCDHIAKQPYLVVIKAADDYFIPGPNGPVLAPLVDIETWLIHVIAPPVQGLTAIPSANKVVLNWQNPYTCASDPEFRGFSVWRKIGCDSFVPDYCETGLAGHGYVKITGANIFNYTYTDNTTVVGQQYSYRVLAHFSKVSPNGIFFYDATESVPSDEVCVFMPIDVPVIINADVQQTDISNGQIFVRWTKPLAGGINLDTILFPPPYRFDLYRGNGFNFSAPALINTKNAASYSAINDTSFTDTGLNTQDQPYSYKVLFFSNNDTIGATSVASSTYLTVQSSDQSLALSWQENVPWVNDSFSVFRFNKLTSVFDSIGLSYTHAYTDTGLINDSTYCYYVKGFGRYTVDALPKPLINKSQEDCAIPIDTVPPCPPTLNVRNDCDQFNGQPWTASQFINYLNWSLAPDSCGSDINHYNIYFGSDSTGLALVDSVGPREDTTFEHVLNDNLAGCYAVTAVDRIGNESGYSNIVCIDNCPYYVLPNTFTPNGDGANDVFHPFLPYRFVPKIEMQIFDRWGVEVFKTDDPYIGWDGTDLKTKKPLNDGVYFYAGYYYEQRLGGLVKKPLSDQKKGGGFIHLIRGK